MSLLTVAEARAQVNTGLGDPDLQAVIDREESYLEGELGAPIAGERVQEIWLSRDRVSPDNVYLLRPANQLAEVTDNGVNIDPANVRILGDGILVEREDRAWQGPLLAFRYTPKDALRVTRVVVELIRLTLSETGFNSEDIGDYRYQRSGILQATSLQIQAANRTALVRSLRFPKARPSSIQLHSWRYERVGA